MVRTIRNIIFPLIFTAVTITSVKAAEMLHIVDNRTSSDIKEKVDIAAKYYGIKVNRINLDNVESLLEINKILDRPIDGIIINTGSDLKSDKLDIKSITQNTINSRTPILIYDIGTAFSQQAIEKWSEGGIQSCKPLPQPAHLRFSDDPFLKRIIKQLSGVKIPYPIKSECYFVTKNNVNVKKLIMTDSVEENNNASVFLMIDQKHHPVFFSSNMKSDTETKWNSEHVYSAMWGMTPILMFMAFCGGDKYWHPPGHYATLMIDDPWLIEPYGYLNYNDLLREMQKVNFHSSIAFIPWYFEQNHKNVVELFRSHPDRFSLSIHGNNHDLKEFGINDSNEYYTHNIGQSVKRMERFKEITGIPYDKVMVFPRGIVPKKAFRVLKRNNFLATVNSPNIPTGEQNPHNLLFYMHSGTLEYENFLSIRRHKIGFFEKADIALEIFLGNPVIFHTHHDFFENGINSFNSIATFVNEIEPTMKWVGLGEIIKHQYLIKREGQGRYSVIMFSPNIKLENKETYPIKIDIQNNESFSVPIKRSQLDGTLLHWDNEGSIHKTIITIPPQSSRVVDIEYEEKVTSKEISLRNNNISILIIRILAELRDITLPKIVTFIRNTFK